MEKIEELATTTHGLFVPVHGDVTKANESVVRVLRLLRREVVAQAVKKLWQELCLEGEPLIFDSPTRGLVQMHHDAFALKQLLTAGARRKRSRFGELQTWSLLEAPAYAHGIAATGHADMLLKVGILHSAEIGDRNTIPSSPYSWMRYTFVSGWTGLSVHFYDADESEHVAMTVVPLGHQGQEPHASNAGACESKPVLTRLSSQELR